MGFTIAMSSPFGWFLWSTLASCAHAASNKTLAHIAILIVFGIIFSFGYWYKRRSDEKGLIKNYLVVNYFFKVIKTQAVMLDEVTGMTVQISCLRISAACFILE
jgi:hypothetical protein